MKNNLPCEIVVDLLPSFLEGLTSSESNTAISQHLECCPSCRAAKENMQCNSQNIKHLSDFSPIKEKKLFSKINKKINKRVKLISASSFIAVIAVIIIFNVLFSMPIKTIDLNDISVSVESIPVSELTKCQIHPNNNNQVIISYGESDNSQIYNVSIPGINNNQIFITADVLDKSGFITTITWSSPYFIKNIEYCSNPNSDGSAIYISSFKTTVLGNKAPAYAAQTVQAEFKKIDKIIFVEHNGSETILWQNN